mmetsp:Transcript_95407/g.291787  ORF Transcript_95407/g.291787 Transcript_95407/m.291787 type:complete len:224 (-) Transcript_95407:692-1363(-)
MFPTGFNSENKPIIGRLFCVFAEAFTKRNSISYGEMTRATSLPSMLMMRLPPAEAMQSWGPEPKTRTLRRLLGSRPMNMGLCNRAAASLFCIHDGWSACSASSWANLSATLLSAATTALGSTPAILLTRSLVHSLSWYLSWSSLFLSRKGRRTAFWSATPLPGSWSRVSSMPSKALGFSAYLCFPMSSWCEKAAANKAYSFSASAVKTSPSRGGRSFRCRCSL